MARLEQLIHEIQGLKQETNHRSSLRILSLLQNNKALFLQALDADYLNMAIKNFELICAMPSKDYGTPAYIRDYEKYYDSLLFYLNRIV
jgi:hypothetical protein